LKSKKQDLQRAATTGTSSAQLGQVLVAIHVSILTKA
jgi:hypothetical protein